MQNAPRYVKFIFYRSRSKDMTHVLERLDDTSTQIEKSLTNYSELSSVTSAVQNMVSLTHSKVVNLSLRREVILFIFLILVLHSVIYAVKFRIGRKAYEE